MQLRHRQGLFSGAGTNYIEKAKSEFNCQIPSGFVPEDYYSRLFGQFHTLIHNEADRNLIKDILFERITEDSQKEFFRILKLLVINNSYLILEQVLQKYDITDELGGELLICAVNCLNLNMLDILIRNDVKINATPISLILQALSELGKNTEAKLAIIEKLLEYQIDVDVETETKNQKFTTRETCRRIYNGLLHENVEIKKDLGLIEKNVREINRIIDVMEKVFRAPKQQPVASTDHQQFSVRANRT